MSSDKKIRQKNMFDLFGNDHNKLAKTKEEGYRAYLASSAWKLKRKQALARAGNKCEVCGITSYAGKLDVHHKTYTRFGHESLDDLQVVCKSCHEQRDEARIEETQRRNEQILKAAQFNGWVSKVYGEEWNRENWESYRKKFDNWLRHKGDE